MSPKFIFILTLLATVPNNRNSFWQMSPKLKFILKVLATVPHNKNL